MQALPHHYLITTETAEKNDDNDEEDNNDDNHQGKEDGDHQTRMSHPVYWPGLCPCYCFVVVSILAHPSTLQAVARSSGCWVMLVILFPLSWFDGSLSLQSFSSLTSSPGPCHHLPPHCWCWC